MAALLAMGLGGKGGREVLYCQDMVRFPHSFVGVRTCSFLTRRKLVTLQVPEHAELAWILNCSTPMGKLQRMTTWKVRPLQPNSDMFPLARPDWFEHRVCLLQGKIAVHKNHATEEDVSETDLNLGLFAYPVLQAADILLYKCVPLHPRLSQTLTWWNPWADISARALMGGIRKQSNACSRRGRSAAASRAVEGCCC